MNVKQPENDRKSRVALVMVEMRASDTTDAETVAAQWAQSVRFNLGAHGVDVGEAHAVILDGSMADLATALRAAHDGLTT